MKRSAIERFVDKVRVTNKCYWWIAAKNLKGYGRFSFQGRLVGAHRFIYEHYNGPIPRGLMVLHRCDNPSCVRPEHLFIGNALTNLQDATKKGRVKFSGRPKTRVETQKVLTNRRLAREYYWTKKFALGYP